MNYQREDEFTRQKYKLRHSCTEADPEFSKIKNRVLTGLFSPCCSKY
jgi:hypothetical protein